MGSRAVFINCPFSEDYQEKFRAIVFTVIRAGFEPRCAREYDDGGEVRIEKICRIIKECPYGIHDISNTDLDPGSLLPRFNMPFELGLYLGAKMLGPKPYRGKKYSFSISLRIVIKLSSRTFQGRTFIRTAAK